MLHVCLSMAALVLPAACVCAVYQMLMRHCDPRCLTRHCVLRVCLSNGTSCELQLHVRTSHDVAACLFCNLIPVHHSSYKFEVDECMMDAIEIQPDTDGA